MKSIATVEPINRSEPEVLFLARMALNEQMRFARRVFIFVTGALLLLLAGFFYFTNQLLMPGPVAAAVQKTPAVDQVSLLNRELRDLQQQLGKAVTETLSMKLATLEERIRLGNAGLQDLEMIQSIKQDIRLLQNRSGLNSKSSGVTAQAARNSAVGGQDAAAQLKLARLQNLFYFTLVSMGMLAVAIGGYWLQNGVRLRRLDADLARLQQQFYQELRH